MNNLTQTLKRNYGAKTLWITTHFGGRIPTRLVYINENEKGENDPDKIIEFVKMVQKENLVIGGAMTDPKGDRSKGPSDQEDPDLFTRIVDTDDKGVYVSGAKAHQTGCINSHWILLMPTIRLTEKVLLR